MGKPKPGKTMNKTSQQYKLHRQKANARNQKYKDNLSEEKREIMRAKARERYRKKKELGLIQPISERSERENRRQRKIWKNATSKYRRNKILDNITSTPPSLEKDLNCPSTSLKNSGRKKVAKSRAKAYRDLEKKEKENEKLKKKVGKYKQRWLRLKASSSASLTPRRKVAELLKGKQVSKTVSKRLLFGEVLKEQLKENLRLKCSTQKEKQLFHKVICGKIIKKYRFLNMTQNFLSRRITKICSNSKNLNYERKKRNCAISDFLKKAIRDFYEDDENSRMSPCKRDYVTRSNEKVQKRILTKSINEVHEKFINEKKIKISYTTFCRMKPFWVVPPKMRDRETCACIKHENMQFITSKLYYLKIVKERKPDSLFTINLDELKINRDLKQIVHYFAWETVKEERNIKGSLKTITKMAKVEKSSTLEELIEKLKIDVPKYENHVKIMIQQASALKEIKEDLHPNEILFHIDFSENYELKFHKEVQSMHFGASKKQISLHTVIMYTKIENKLKAKSFCTVSEDLSHQAHAVWSHMACIFDKLKKDCIEKVHFFSDGPTGQYRNRYNIFLMVKLTQIFFPKLIEATWNFSCSGHGKGAMDGIGGSLKRTADSFVLHGGDISSVEDFVQLFQKSKVDVLLVNTKKFEEMKEELPLNVIEIPNISKLHQIKWDKTTEKLHKRELSCWKCPTKCRHFSYEITSYQIKMVSENKEKLNLSDWVAVVFSDQWYPGVIENITRNILLVSFMTVCGKNKFAWPQKEDIHEIQESHILCKIMNCPEPATTRYFKLQDEDFNEVQNAFHEFNSINH